MKTFEISETQCTKLKEWQEHIKAVFGEYGEYTYKFTPTGVGVCIEVYSKLANKCIDLTDLSKY